MSNRKKPTTVRRDKPSLAATPAPAHQGVVIGYVHPGQVSSYFLQSMLGTVLFDRTAGQHVAGILNEWSSANISTARNKIVQTFLDDYEAEWLLFVDADMAWEVNAIPSLLAIADPENVPVVGGLCFGSRNDELFPTIYVLTELEDGRAMTMRLQDFPDDTLVRCSATGAAFLMVHRGVLEKMKAQVFNEVFPWFQETTMSGEPVSEDITFCLRAGALGVPVHVNTALRIGHHKTTVLTHERFRSQRAQAEAAST